MALPKSAKTSGSMGIFLGIWLDGAVGWISLFNDGGVKLGSFVGSIFRYFLIFGTSSSSWVSKASYTRIFPKSRYQLSNYLPNQRLKIFLCYYLEIRC